MTTDVSEAAAQLKSVNTSISEYFSELVTSLSSGTAPPEIKDLVTSLDTSELERRAQQSGQSSADFGAGVSIDTVHQAYALSREFNLVAMTKYDMYVMAEQFYKRDGNMFRTKAYSHEGVITGKTPYSYSV